MSLSVLFSYLYGIVGLIESFFAEVSDLWVMVRKVNELVVCKGFDTHVIEWFVIMFYAEYDETIDGKS